MKETMSRSFIPSQPIPAYPESRQCGIRTHSLALRRLDSTIATVLPLSGSRMQRASLGRFCGALGFENFLNLQASPKPPGMIPAEGSLQRHLLESPEMLRGLQIPVSFSLSLSFSSRLTSRPVLSLPRKFPNRPPNLRNRTGIDIHRQAECLEHPRVGENIQESGRAAEMGVLTQAGLQTIGDHKYQSGGYTPLDLLMYKVWWDHAIHLIPMVSCLQCMSCREVSNSSCSKLRERETL